MLNVSSFALQRNNRISIFADYFYRYISAWQLCALFNSMDVVITPKLHVGIVSASLSKSVLCYPHHIHKTMRYYRQIDQQDRCILLSEVTEEAVYQMINQYHDKSIVLSEAIRALAKTSLDALDALNKVRRWGVHMRAKKTFANIVWGFMYELVAILCGFILPRLILTSFGSEYNGVTSAVTQFLHVISLFQAGIGGVTMAALYKPLADKNIMKISVIIKSTERFMRKVVLIFVGFTIIVACVYPFLVIDEFEWFFTASLVLIMSLSTVAQYFFGQTYHFLLNADQHQRLISMVNICKLIANTAISVVMIRAGYGIREVKLAAAGVYILAPILLSVYVKRKYGIMSQVESDNSVISQRWDNFGQQVASFVNVNTDLVVLSIFTNVYEVSVYTVYNLVFSGLYGLITPLTKGVEAAFGNMLAKEEHTLLKKNLRLYELIVFSATTFIFSIALAMALPFVSLYTRNVADVDYHRPLFLLLMIIAFMFRCFRFPYEGLVKAAGHFRQTRKHAFAEAGINIAVSLAFVSSYGIVGVAIGTLAAYVFRSIRYARYISKNIICRSMGLFAKRMALSCICLMITMGIASIIRFADATNYATWAFNTAIVAIIAYSLVFLMEYLFYRNDLRELIKMARGALRKNRKPIKQC